MTTATTPDELQAAKRSVPPEDRILRRPLAWELLRFGLPLALGMALQNAFNLIDAWLVKELPFAESNAAVGALGVCDQLAAVGSIVSYGISTATATLLSQRKGAGDEAGVKRVAFQSIYLVSALSLLFGVLGMFSPFLLRDLVGLKGAVADIGERYLRVSMAGAFSIFFLLHLGTIQRALGSAKTPVFLLVIGNVLNLLFAVVCLFGPDAPTPALAFGAKIAKALSIPTMGMVGAAWATVAARVLVLIPNIIVLLWRFDTVPKDKRVDWATCREIGQQAWPTSVQFVLRIASFLFVNSLVARYFSSETNQSASTAMGLVFRVDTLALFVAMGWGSSAQTFVGQNVGAGALERAKRAGWVTAGYNAILACGIIALVFWQARGFLQVFGRDEGALDIAVTYLHTVAPSYLPLGVGVVLGNGMVGAGKAKLTLGLDLAILLGIQVPGSLLAIWVFHAGLQGVFNVVALSAVASCVLYGVVYARGKWLTKLSA
jgi:putative MATE family efflux protein